MTVDDAIGRNDRLKTEPHMYDYTTGQLKRRRGGPEESSYEGIEAFEQRSASASARGQISNRSFLKIYEEPDQERKRLAKPNTRKFKVLLQ